MRKIAATLVLLGGIGAPWGCGVEAPPASAPPRGRLAAAVAALAAPSLAERTEAARVVRADRAGARRDLEGMVAGPRESPAGRALALRILGEERPPRVEVLRLAAGALGDSSTAVVREAEAILAGGAPPALEALLDGLRHGTPLGRSRAARLVARLGEGAALRAVALLGPGEEEETRAAALEVFARLGERTPEGVARLLPRLLGCLEASSRRVRDGAARALAPLALLAPAAAFGPASLLGDPRAEIRAAASRALSLQGAAALDALAARLEEAAAPPEARRAACSTIGAMEEPTPRGVAILAERVSDPDPGVRLASVRALGRLGGRRIKPAYPALIRALDDPEGSIREAAEVALAHIGPAAAERLARLLPRLRSDRVRLHAISALRRMKGDAAVAIPALLEERKSGAVEIREAAARALSRIRRGG